MERDNQAETGHSIKRIKWRRRRRMKSRRENGAGFKEWMPDSGHDNNNINNNH